jgi:hypothetical protein
VFFTSEPTGIGEAGCCKLFEEDVGMGVYSTGGKIAILSELRCEGPTWAQCALMMSLVSVCYTVKVSTCKLHVVRVRVNDQVGLHMCIEK